MSRLDGVGMGSPAVRPFDVLLLDFGGVCLVSPVELHRHVETGFGLAEGTLDWTGPISPGDDPLYMESIGSDGITEREYWEIRARQIGDLAGMEVDTRSYMRTAYDHDEDHLIRPEAAAVRAAAAAAGMGVSVLTNDLRAFHDDEWVKGISFLTAVDQVIDLSHRGILKPAREAYELALSHLGASADRVLFVDDQPANVTGAEAVGLAAMWFDISRATRSWQAVAERIGVDPDLPAGSSPATAEGRR